VLDCSRFLVDQPNPNKPSHLEAVDQYKKEE